MAVETAMGIVVITAKATIDIVAFLWYNIARCNSIIKNSRIKLIAFSPFFVFFV